MNKATKIRHKAQALRSSLQAQGVEQVDALAQECGFLMGSIEGLVAQLQSYTGENAKAARGCQIAEVHDATGTYTVEVEYTPGQRGRFSGPPEKCYPDEPSELNIVQVLINGEWLDPQDLIHPDVLERWTDTLCTEFDEADQ